MVRLTRFDLSGPALGGADRHRWSNPASGSCSADSRPAAPITTDGDRRTHLRRLYQAESP